MDLIGDTRMRKNICKHVLRNATSYDYISEVKTTSKQYDSTAKIHMVD